jgi:hypothetical protein
VLLYCCFAAALLNASTEDNWKTSKACKPCIKSLQALHQKPASPAAKPAPLN